MEKRKWSTSEKEYLIKNYYNFTIEELAKQLNRSKSSIGSKAYFLIIKDSSRKKTDWTDEDINTLLNNYNDLTYKELSKLLNKSESCIYKKLRQLNIDRTKSVYWTEEDDLFLELNWGVKSISFICKELGRNPSAVRRRGYSKELGGMYNTGYNLTVAEISAILNIDSSTIYHWIKTKKLKSINRTFDKKKGVFVKFETFYDFLRDNPKLWNATKVEYMALNQEEEWLKKKRREDDNKLKYKSNTSWTRKEEEELIKMLLDNKTLNEIVRSINRTKNSIKSKRRKLREQKRI